MCIVITSVYMNDTTDALQNVIKGNRVTRTAMYNTVCLCKSMRCIFISK